MRRLMFAAVSCGLVIAGPVTAQQKPAGPIRPPVENGEWTPVEVSKDGATALLVRAAKPVGGYKRIWVRYEYMKSPVTVGENRTWSVAALNEVDCKEERGRMLSVTRYSKPNLMGDALTSGEQYTWDYLRPGTMGYISIELLCGED